MHPSDRFGRYVITEWLGAGGMSDVYRARDERLDRDVALKILAEERALDRTHLARFAREAQLLSTLSHPNIATLLGVEESEGRQALVMELVEGETLTECMSRGIDADHALAYALQMADGLESAHQRGIIHRDLKPSNIKVRPDGVLKVLDFGLAKELRLDGPTADVAATTVTLTGPLGPVVGTAAYMSPEQARGADVDRRTDVWSFGCVLFEMLTGRRAFDGATTSDVIANIINRDPDLDALPAGTSPAIRRLIRRCLQKDVADRLRDIGDARLEIKEAQRAEDHDDAAVTRTGGRRRGRVVGLVAAVLVGGMGGAALLWTLGTSATEPKPVSRYALSFTAAAPFASSTTTRSNLAMSGDGARIAFRSVEGTWGIRTRDRLDTAVVGGAGLFVNEPFFSPDGEFLGFFEASDAGVNLPSAELRKTPVGGGPSTIIATVGSRFLGAVWTENDTIVFAVADGLFSVPASGGKPQLIAAPDRERGELSIGWPSLLPGGQWALVTIANATGNSVALLDLHTGSRQSLFAGQRARYSPTGHIVYLDRGALHAVAFDVTRREVIGRPTAVVEGVFGVDYALAADGTLAYVAGAETRQVAWVDRQRREEILRMPPRFYVYPRLSPDGTRLALDVGGANRDIWVWDFARETLLRVTTDPEEDITPVWSPDGRRIVFGNRPRVSSLFSQPSDGSGPPMLLATAPESLIPGSITPDGRRVLATREVRDIVAVAMDGSGAIEPLLTSAAVELGPEISPDGEWIAYTSNESGQFEIYVRPSSDLHGPKFQISTAGGTQALWARDQRELFYRAPDGAVIAVPIVLKPSFAPGPSTRLIDGSGYYGGGSNVSGRTYDVSVDGQRFLMLKPAGMSDSVPGDSVIVVENWHQELNRLVPVR